MYGGICFYLDFFVILPIGTLVFSKVSNLLLPSVPSYLFDGISQVTKLEKAISTMN